MDKDRETDRGKRRDVERGNIQEMNDGKGLTWTIFHHKTGGTTTIKWSDIIHFEVEEKTSDHSIKNRQATSGEIEDFAKAALEQTQTSELSVLLAKDAYTELKKQADELNAASRDVLNILVEKGFVNID